jgi:hypothetical protein
MDDIKTKSQTLRFIDRVLDTMAARGEFVPPRGTRARHRLRARIARVKPRGLRRLLSSGAGQR